MIVDPRDFGRTQMNCAAECGWHGLGKDVVMPGQKCPRCGADAECTLLFGFPIVVHSNLDFDSPRDPAAN